MKPLLKLTFYATLGLITISTLVSCKDEPGTSTTSEEETAEIPPPPVIATLEGTIGATEVSTSLDTMHSTISIEEWDGISDENVDRNSRDLSLEAFLLGTALWSGPPRRITITHHIDDIVLDLRFAGWLAVDEKLTALPGCVLEPNKRSLVPVADGSWESATDVTLPSYDLRFIVTSYDETSETVSGTVEGQLIDPTKPDAEPIPVNLTLASLETPETAEATGPPADPPVDEEAKPEVTTTRPELAESTDTQSSGTNTADTEAAEPEPDTVENTVTPAAGEPSDEPEIRVAKPVVEENDQEEEEDIEVRRAVPVPPEDRIGF